jgi:hypothetical protein
MLIKLFIVCSLVFILPHTATVKSQESVKDSQNNLVEIQKKN